MYGVIYVITDPRTAEIRYIGQTVNTVAKRLRQHIDDAARGSGTHLRHWLATLRDADIRPVAYPVAIGTNKQHLDDLEIAWIAEFRRRGSRLVNTLAGGSPHSTAEWRSRMSVSTAERMANMTPEEKAEHIRRAHTPEAELRRGESMKDYWQTADTEELAVRNAKVSASMQGNTNGKFNKGVKRDCTLTREEIDARTAKVKAAWEAKTPEELAAHAAKISKTKIAQGCKGNPENLRRGLTPEVHAAAVKKSADMRRGVPISEEHRKALHDGLKRAWAEGRMPVKKVSTKEEIWAKYGGQCVTCGTTEKHHKSRGNCTTCHDKSRPKRPSTPRPKKS